MTLKQMDKVLIVVDDFEVAKAFFGELVMELEANTNWRSILAVSFSRMPGF